MQFKTSGVCAKQIDFELDGDVIQSVQFTGGCNGNLTGIGALVKGMSVDDAIQKLAGIKCGPRATSCPDQLSIALTQAKQVM